MLLLESDLIRPSTNLKVIDARQEALKVMRIEQEQSGASAELLNKLDTYIDWYDRMREDVEKRHADFL